MFPSNLLPDGWSHSEWQRRIQAQHTPPSWRSDEDLEMIERAIAWTPPLPFENAYDLSPAQAINP